MCSTACVCQLALLILTRLLRANEQQFWETVAGFLFRPNILVSFILTGVLNTRSHHWQISLRCSESVTSSLTAALRKNWEMLDFMQMSDKQQPITVKQQEVLLDSVLLITSWHISFRFQMQIYILLLYIKFSVVLKHTLSKLPSSQTCQSGSASDGNIWKYLSASCSGGSVCSFRRVQVSRKSSSRLKVNKPRRSFP